MNVTDKKRILVITTRFPFEMEGACPQDRAYGVTLLKKLGYEVKVITMCFPKHLSEVKKYEEEFRVKIVPIVYEEHTDRGKTIVRKIQQIMNPRNWDGSAFEFTRKEVRNVLQEQILDFGPDIIWCDYSYMWRLYPLIHSFKIPIITRSINYEPDHFYKRPHEFHNRRRSRLIKWMQYLSKTWGEKEMLKQTDFLFSITPKEKTIYEQIDSSVDVLSLPLRRLGGLIGRYYKPIEDHDKYNIFYMGANYKVAHMKQALYFILNEVAPKLHEKYPNQFTIHFTGKKMPQEIINKIKDGNYKNIKYHGFVEEMDEFINKMDIAISPSLSGAGMQQKIFESLVRGIPTVTNERGLVGYPYQNNIHYIAAESTAHSYVEALEKMKDVKLRKEISKNAVRLSHELFCEDIIKCIISNGIEKVTK